MEFKVFELLLGRMDKISDEMKEMKELQAVHNEILKDHTRRSELNEEAVKLLKMEIDNSAEKLDKQMEPIKNHVKYVEVSLKIFGGICAASAFILTVIQIIKSF